MSQDPEQPPFRPEANGHSEHIIPELPQQHVSDEAEQPLQSDAQYPYGSYSAAEPREVPVQSSPPAPSAPPSYDSPEFYTQPQQAVPDSEQAQQVQQSMPQRGYSDQPPYGYPPPQYGVPSPTPSYPPYGASSDYGHGASQPYGGYSGQYGPHGQYGPYGYNGYRRFDFDAEPQSSPLPLGEAIRGLFAQYGQVITHPSPRTFAREMGKAKWNIVWVQIIAYSIIVALFSLISSIGIDVNAAANSVVAGADTNGLSPSMVNSLQHILTIVYAASIYGQVLITPITLFIAVGILYLLAKAFGGTGKFLTQLYCSLLFLVPLGVISNFLTLLLSYLPAAGSAFAFLIIVARLVYECVLLGFLLIPVHRISGGRATGAILLLGGVVVLLACVFAFVFAAIFAAALGTA